MSDFALSIACILGAFLAFPFIFAAGKAYLDFVADVLGGD